MPKIRKYGGSVGLLAGRLEAPPFYGCRSHRRNFFEIVVTNWPYQ